MDFEAMPIFVLDRETVRQLSRRSNWRGLAQLATHSLVLLATAFLIWASRGSLWLVPAILAHGIVLNFLFCPLHESIHRTAFASGRVNDALAIVCGLLLVLPPEYFRMFHFTHHRFTQDPARDPELLQAPIGSLGVYLWRVTGLPNWYDRLRVTLRHALSAKVTETFVTQAKRAVIVREARIFWAAYLAVAFLSVVLLRADVLYYWLLPLIAGQPVLRLFLLAEHSDCELSDDMFANTRTTYTNRVVRFLSWQMSYHAEHHAFPSVPFHALARVNAHTKARLAVTAPGYLGLHLSSVRKLRNGRKPTPDEPV